MGGLVRTADPFGELVQSLLDRGSTVDAVADAVGYSPRQLHRRLLPLFGYGPQHLGRVLRLVRAVADADAGSRGRTSPSGRATSTRPTWCATCVPWQE